MALRSGQRLLPPTHPEALASLHSALLQVCEQLPGHFAWGRCWVTWQMHVSLIKKPFKLHYPSRSLGPIHRITIMTITVTSNPVALYTLQRFSCIWINWDPGFLSLMDQVSIRWPKFAPFPLALGWDRYLGSPKIVQNIEVGVQHNSGCAYSFLFKKKKIICILQGKIAYFTLKICLVMRHRETFWPFWGLDHRRVNILCQK